MLFDFFKRIIINSVADFIYFFKKILIKFYSNFEKSILKMYELKKMYEL